ncbi:MAG: twin-arginine translocation signal domain-containing protein [Bacteroidaceae bacterium]|nr:twin-arginine translocation signal domain-containing protein [Bacteroidaceae bacterium]
MLTIYTRRDFLKITAAGGILASMGQTAEAKSADSSGWKSPRYCASSSAV